MFENKFPTMFIFNKFRGFFYNEKLNFNDYNLKKLILILKWLNCQFFYLIFIQQAGNEVKFKIKKELLHFLRVYYIFLVR